MTAQDLGPAPFIHTSPLLSPFLQGGGRSPASPIETITAQ